MTQQLWVNEFFDEIFTLKRFCFVFIARQQCSMLMRDIDIANLSVRPSVCLSVRYVPVPDENGLTYRHSFFTIR